MLCCSVLYSIVPKFDPVVHENNRERRGVQSLFAVHRVEDTWYSAGGNWRCSKPPGGESAVLSPKLARRVARAVEGEEGLGYRTYTNNTSGP